MHPELQLVELQFRVRPMTRRSSLRAVLAAACLLVPLLTAPNAGCFKKATDEDRVRGVIQDIITGAMDGDVGDVMEHISRSYRAESADYEGLHGLLVQSLLRRGPILVLPGPIEVSISGDTAHARFDAAIAEGTGRWGDMVNADGWHLEVDFVREPPGDAEGEWRVIGHERTSAGG